MQLTFNSIQELREFMDLINRDKDSLIKSESNELNKTAAELQKSVDKSKEGEKK